MEGELLVSRRASQQNKRDLKLAVSAEESYKILQTATLFFRCFALLRSRARVECAKYWERTFTAIRITNVLVPRASQS